MTEKIRNIRTFYRSIGSYTRLVIRVTLISVVTLILLAVYTYTATNHPYYYELLSICDELLSVTKSVAAVGFVGVLWVYASEKNE